MAPVASIELPPESPKEPDLSERETEVLLAVLESDESQIHAYRTDGDDAEIKAGATRMAGDDALAAMRRLLEMGYVEPIDDASFVLTEDGRRAANVLHKRRR